MVLLESLLAWRRRRADGERLSVAALLARLLLAIVAVVAPGCSRVPIQPPYTQQELAQECERHHARWHADALTGGFCEYDSKF